MSTGGQQGGGARGAPHSARSLHFGEPQQDRRDGSKQSNLVRMRSSALGKSAPSLSNHMKETCVARRPSRLHSHAAHHRLSLVVGGTSPLRCSSPLESPRVPVASAGPLHPLHPLHHPPVITAAVATRRAKDLLTDGRRWSVASLPSSGYGTTPGSSSLSSQCSSQERLHQLAGTGQGLSAEDGRMGARRCSPAPPAPIKCAHCSAPVGNISNSQGSGINQWQSLSDSGGSGSGGAGTDSPQSPFRRPRSRSLSSPARSPVSGDDQVAAMSAMFASRFPKAQKQMEARLRQLAAEPPPRSAPPIVRFVHNQVLEMARDCLHKSEAKQINSRYFYDMTENLDRLLQETREKADDSAAVGRVSALITRLLLAVSRSARLLECLEFDPQQFYRLLEAAEGRARETQGVTAELPQYIIHKLGLSRDPLQEDPPPPPPLPPASVPPLPHSSPKNKARVGGLSPTENDYQVIKLISNGAYGAVYLVKHTQTRQRFAMKKINKNNLMLRNQVEQVFAERDILSFADNPFVVSMYCSFETRRHLCLVLELVEGGDCASLLRAIGPLPSDMARFYFAEAILAVEYLHSYGIVHRDLKPDNLLITALGHIKLTDFGLSKMGLMSLATNLYEEYVDRETQQFSDKQVCGTPEYIAPEVILRQGYGKPVDWWSMGVILYEFLIGCVPFFGETPEELFAHTVNDDIEWPDEEDFLLIPEAKDIITTLLARSPRDRLGTGGTHQVKEHVYFYGVDWTSLLRQKAEFVPQLENDEDTSYFDSRCDRYNHSEADTDCDTGDDSPVLFGTFSSMSPQYRKFQSNSTTDLSFGDVKMMGGSMESCPGTPDSQGEPLIGSIAAPTTPGTPPPIVNNHKCLFHNNGRAPLHSTPESSQTDSDDVSPHLARKRRTNNFATAGGCTPQISTGSSLGVPGSTPKLLVSSRGSRDNTSFSPLAGNTTYHSIPAPSFSISMEEEVSSIDTNNSSSDTSNVLSLSGSAKATSASTTVTSNSSNPNTSIAQISIITTSAGPATAGTSLSANGGAIANSQTNSINSNNAAPTPSPIHKHVKKSASASGLSLIIQSDDSFCSVGGAPSPPAGNTSSTNSSRDSSPCREGFAPLSIQNHGLLQMSKPPMVIKRGPKGFGFTIHTIRVYFGESDYYTMHHLVSAVSEGGSAWQAGLRAGDLLVWLNGSWVAGLLHTQVLRLLLASPRQASVRALPLDQTTIQSGGRKRGAWQGRAVGRPNALPGASRRTGATGERRAEPERRRRASLFRRISNKRASAEIQQMVSSGLASPVSGTAPAAPRFGSPPQRMSLGPPSSLLLSTGLNSAPPSLLIGPNINTMQSSDVVPGGVAACPASPASPATERVLLPGESAPSKVAHHYQRPSTLHGLKHKLGGAGGGGGKTTGARRKSAGHIPLSPLARTPSPGPVASSPTRSPSPLALCHHASGPACNPNTNASGNNTTPSVVTRGRDHHVRAQGAPRAWPREPASPLLRRALSPDRLHPRSAESKCALISPLCCAQATSSTPNPSRSKGGSALWRPLASAAPVPAPSVDRTPEPVDQNKHFGGSLQHTLGPSSNSSFAVVIPQQKQSQKQNISQENSASEYCMDIQGNIISAQHQSSDINQYTIVDTAQSRMSLSLNAPVDFLPRIAEEKDSPTNSTASHIHEVVDEKKVEKKIIDSDKQVLIIDHKKNISVIESPKLSNTIKNDAIKQSPKNTSSNSDVSSSSGANSLNTTKSLDSTSTSFSSELDVNLSTNASNIKENFDKSIGETYNSNTVKKKSDVPKEVKKEINPTSDSKPSLSDKTSTPITCDSDKKQEIKKNADIKSMSKSPSIVGQITSKLESLNLKSIQDTEQKLMKSSSDLPPKMLKQKTETTISKTHNEIKLITQSTVKLPAEKNNKDSSGKPDESFKCDNKNEGVISRGSTSKESEKSIDKKNVQLTHEIQSNQVKSNQSNKQSPNTELKPSSGTIKGDNKLNKNPASLASNTNLETAVGSISTSEFKIVTADKQVANKSDKQQDPPSKVSLPSMKFEGITLRNVCDQPSQSKTNETISNTSVTTTTSTSTGKNNNKLPSEPASCSKKFDSQQPANIMPEAAKPPPPVEHKTGSNGKKDTPGFSEKAVKKKK